MTLLELSGEYRASAAALRERVLLLDCLLYTSDAADESLV